MTSIAAALGLLFAPALGMPVGAAFNALGQDAVFGPGCSEDGGTAIQAPARWRKHRPGIIKALGSGSLTIMAEFSGAGVHAVHLAQPAAYPTTIYKCRALLDRLPGGTVVRHDVGSTVVFEKPTYSVAGEATHYRALFRATREQCRIMLTIGG